MSSRLIAIVIALVASLATPASVVAHGFAHHEFAEHHALAPSASADSIGLAAPAISPSETDQTHGHPLIAEGIVLRWNAAMPALPADDVEIRSAVITEESGPRWTLPVRFVPRSIAATPNPTRAPPSR